MTRLFAVRAINGHKPVVFSAEGKLAAFFESKREAKTARDAMNAGADLYCVTRGPDHRHYASGK